MPGIIGGSGIYDLPGLAKVREERVKSPWGEPSTRCASARCGAAGGVPVSPRPGPSLSPSDINYRANIDALKRVGVTDLISLSACGSFKEELPPGTFVMVDQFDDRTIGAKAFFGRAGRPCFDGASDRAALRRRIVEAALKEGTIASRGDLRLHGGAAVFLARPSR